MRFSQVPRGLSHRSAEFVMSRVALEQAFLPRLRAATSLHGIFALSEISKGIVIVWIGDVATADAVGDLVGALAYPAHAWRDVMSILSTTG